MKLELKNDTLLVKIIERFGQTEQQKRLEKLGIVLPETTTTITDFGAADLAAVAHEKPILIGEIVDRGPGMTSPKGVLLDMPELQAGVKVAFAIRDQIGFKDGEDIKYLIGFGNVLGMVED